MHECMSLTIWEPGISMFTHIPWPQTQHATPPSSNISILSVVPSFPDIQAHNTDLSTDSFLSPPWFFVKSCQFSLTKIYWQLTLHLAHTHLFVFALPTFSTLYLGLIILYLPSQLLLYRSSCLQLPPPSSYVLLYFLPKPPLGISTMTISFQQLPKISWIMLKIFRHNETIFPISSSTTVL